MGSLEVGGCAPPRIPAPCHRGWRFKPEQGIEVARVAVETRFWPLFEWERGGKYTVNAKPKEKRPVEEWLKM